MKNEERDFEEVEDNNVDKDSEKVIVNREEYDKMVDELNVAKDSDVIEKDSNDISTLLSVLSWIAFAIGLIPFFPYKTMIMVFGIVTGYLYNKNYNGSKSAFVANIVSVIIRLIIWALVLLFLPLWAWWTVLFM